VRLRGAALECRVYAEDPANGFFPSPGLITRHEAPAGPGVRLDSGVYEGSTVPLDYDPLLSKLVVWGASRAEAIARMRRALSEYEIVGVETTIPFFRRVLEDTDFVAGRIDTGFIDRVLAEAPREEPSEEAELAALVAAALAAWREAPRRIPVESPRSAWRTAGRDTLLNRWPARVTRGR
jgi:acetyl-CoA carboxylase biotin carboxylase subunit